MKVLRVIGLMGLILLSKGNILFGQQKATVPVPRAFSNGAFGVYYAGRGNLQMALYYTMLAGDSSRSQGNLIDAEDKYVEAASLSEKIAGKGGPYHTFILESVFDPYERLGLLYLQSNNLRKAEKYFDKARELKDQHLARHSIYRVSPYTRLGEVYLRKGDPAKARIYFETAQHLTNAATTSFYDYGIQERDINAGLYEVEMATGDLKKAYHYLQKSASGGLYTGGDQIPGIFQKKADYYLQTGGLEKCRYYLDKSKLYARGISFSAVFYRIKRTEALLHWKEKNWSATDRSFGLLLDAYKQHVSRNFAAMTDNDRELFSRSFKEDFDLYNAYVVQNDNPQQQDQRYSMLYDNQLFGKALLLNEINKIKNQIAQSGNPELKSKLDQWQREKANLANLYFAKHRDEEAIEKAESVIEELEHDLNQNSPLLRAVKSDLHWQDVRQGLKDGEAAVEIVRIRRFDWEGAKQYHFSDSVLYAVLFVDAHSEHPACFLIENGNQLEDRYLHYYRNAIQARQKDTISYQQFWLPFKQRLGAYHRLYISCDGVYNQINLNALYHAATDRYVLDETDIVLVTNTKDILSRSRAATSRTASFFGRPAYQFTAPAAGENRERITRSLANESLENLREQKFDDLPQTGEEIAAIGRVLTQQQWKVEEFTGSLASEAKIKSVSSPTVLHIATHGFFLKSDVLGYNAMVGSGIILSGINNTEATEEDGILTALEATGLHLDSTELVVLSACETGLGEVKNGEGVYGLQRGFIVAGTKHLLMSLWKVDDVATRFLMEEFYGAWLRSGDLHGAMKSAQVSLRKKYPDPYDWGAFILFGD